MSSVRDCRIYMPWGEVRVEGHPFLPDHSALLADRAVTQVLTRTIDPTTNDVWRAVIDLLEAEAKKGAEIEHVTLSAKMSTRLHDEMRNHMSPPVATSKIWDVDENALDNLGPGQVTFIKETVNERAIELLRGAIEMWDVSEDGWDAWIDDVRRWLKEAEGLPVEVTPAKVTPAKPPVDWEKYKRGGR